MQIFWPNNFVLFSYAAVISAIWQHQVSQSLLDEHKYLFGDRVYESDIDVLLLPHTCQKEHRCYKMSDESSPIDTGGNYCTDTHFGDGSNVGSDKFDFFITYLPNVLCKSKYL